MTAACKHDALQRRIGIVKRTTSVGLSTQRESDYIRGNADGATGAAAAGVDSQVVGATALAAASGEALRVVAAAHVSPLAERGLAEQDGAGVAQLGHDVGVAGHDAAEEGPAARGRLQVVLGANVVLDGKGDAVQRTTDLAVLTLCIALGGNGEDIGVHLHDGAGLRI